MGIETEEEKEGHERSEDSWDMENEEFELTKGDVKRRNQESLFLNNTEMNTSTTQISNGDDNEK